METDREELLARLKAGAADYVCGDYLAGLTVLNRSEIYTALVFDRLKRKMRLVERLFIEAAKEWNCPSEFLFALFCANDRRLMPLRHCLWVHRVY